MASTAMLVKPNTETVISEAQSLALTQQLMLSIFSSISFIREIFKDDVYEDYHLEQVKTKRIKRGINRQADKVLNWIEKGCFDAIEKKYLETALFGVYANKAKPTEMLETYTLKIFYPSSKLHQTLYPENTDGEMSIIINNSQEGSRELRINSKESFRYQLARLVRTVCMMTQRLDPLPKNKCMTMQLTYYEGITPKDYEPPCFRSTIFDVNLAFDMPTYSHEFGPAKSLYHKVSINMTSGLASAFKEELQFVPQIGEKLESPSQQVAILNTVPPDSFVRNPNEKKHVPKVPVEIPPNVNSKVPSKTILSVNPNKQQEKVQCVCTDDSNDLDMVQCDQCHFWQHTPCAGFCSNNDRRISKGYVCLQCQYTEIDNKSRPKLRDLARKRRIISILFSEGISSYSQVQQRLCCSKSALRQLLAELEAENIMQINRLSKIPKFTKISSKETKEYIIGKYFSEITAEKHVELAGLFKPPITIEQSIDNFVDPKRYNAKRRNSAPNEQPSCIPSNGKKRKSAVEEIAQDGSSLD